MRKARRIGLTKAGYGGPSLHRKSLTLSNEEMLESKSQDRKSRGVSPDISAPPLSSSDEESRTSKRGREEANQESDLPPTKRRPTARRVRDIVPQPTKRSNRLARCEVADSTCQTPTMDKLSAREEEFFSLSQQTSSQGRKGRGYGRSSQHQMGSSSSATSLHSKQDGAIKVPGERTTGNADGQVGGSAFKMPRGLLEGSGSSQEEHTFVIRNPISPQPVRPVANRGVRQRASEIADTSLRIEVQQAMDVAGEFKIRDDPLGQISNPSSSPVDAFQDDTFSRITQGPARSSSLSSVPSDSPLDEFNRSTEFIPCPLCETPLHRDFFESYNNGRPLKFSEQHRFCHDHKLNTAKAQWKEKGYPDVQWANWIPSRVDNSHIQTLLEILYSKQPSHYEAILADRASGGVKALQMYLKREIIDVVHPGYYGPKGNKHLTQMIQERLAKQLNRSAKKNPLVRDAGVGGYVQAVLVPELTVLLVKEDMSIETDERAREIIKESSEMGRLIHGEEEDVIHADDSD